MQPARTQRTEDRLDRFRVEPWVDVIGGAVERWPGLWRRLAAAETRRLTDAIGAIEIRAPIFICGLARSGTTILLECLAAHPDTATHRYRDYPGVLAPIVWNRVAERLYAGGSAPRERAHGDGIAVTPDSPEAVAEMLWMAFDAGAHDPARDVYLTAWRLDQPQTIYARFLDGAGRPLGAPFVVAAHPNGGVDLDLVYCARSRRHLLVWTSWRDHTVRLQAIEGGEGPGLVGEVVEVGLAGQGGEVHRQEPRRHHEGPGQARLLRAVLGSAQPRPQRAGQQQDQAELREQVVAGDPQQHRRRSVAPCARRRTRSRARGGTSCRSSRPACRRRCTSTPHCCARTAARAGARWSVAARAARASGASTVQRNR